MIDVSALVGDIPTTTVTLRTYGAATVNAYGEMVTTPSTTSVTAVVHPSGRQTLERFPEIDRQREMISVYVLDAISSSRPAEVDYQGQTYEIVELGDYGTLGGIYLIHAARIDEVSP